MQYPTSLRLFISFRLNSVHMKISCRFEISFRSKWPIWNPYRFEFHFASIHVNTSKELTEHRSEIFNRHEISYRFEFILPLMWTYSKATFWNGSEKLMSVKIHVIKKTYVVKLYSGIHRYFAKQRKIGIIYLVAESRILQYCFCQQPY